MNARFTINNDRRNRCLAYARRLHLRRKTATPFRWRITSTKPVTHRDGITFRPTPVLACATWAERQRLIAELAAQGFNHFVRFCDVGGRFALQYGNADWVGAGIYVD